MAVYEWSDESSVAWSDNVLTSWCSGGLLTLRQVYLDGLFIYTLTVDGCSIFNFDTGVKIAYINYTGGFTAIYITDMFIYFGTSSGGLKYCFKDIIIDNGYVTNLSSSLKAHDFYYNSEGLFIKYIHGSVNTIVVTTELGISVINNSLLSFKSLCLYNNVQQCWLTSKLQLYYIVIENTQFYIYKLNSIKCDWTYNSTVSLCGGIFLPSGTSITDFYVTENTAIDKYGDTIFIATTNGVYIVDTFLNMATLYNFLPGVTNNVISIKASATANSYSGKLYITIIADNVYCLIIDLVTKTIYDNCTVFQKGRANEKLLSNSISATTARLR